MKRGFIWLFIVLLFGGCVVTSEEYRYKQRFDDFYNILDDQEKLQFANNDLEAIGASLDLREEEDPEFATNILNVRIYEAITTFDGYETAYLFRYIILRELLRNQFYDYMDFFTGDEQNLFVRENDFISSHTALKEENRKFRNFNQNLVTDYRLYDYTDEQIIQFFREVSFPEVSRKQVYYLLDFLKDNSSDRISLIDEVQAPEPTGYLAEIRDKNADKDELSLIGLYLMGYIDLTVETLDTLMQDSSGYGLKKEFKEIKKLAGLNNMDIEQFLSAFYEVVMQEMDQEALRKTIKKF